jgi:hypothetical protein
MKNLKTMLLAVGFAAVVTSASADVYKWADLVDACLAKNGAPTCYVNINKKISCYDEKIAMMCSRQANDALRPKRLDRSAASRNVGVPNQPSDKLQRPAR